MFATLANLNRRFAVSRAVNILFVLSLVISTTMSSHAHVAHANHGHGVHSISAHESHVKSETELSDKSHQTGHQDQEKDLQDNTETDEGTIADPAHCCVLMLPTLPTMKLAVIGQSIYEFFTTSFNSRQPDGLKRPPKHTA